MENSIITKIKVTKFQKAEPQSPTFISTFEVNEDGLYIGDDYIYIEDITVDDFENPTRVKLWGFRKNSYGNNQLTQLQVLDRMDKIEILETE